MECSDDMKDLLLQVYVPFCGSTCPYCDLPTERAELGVINRYTLAMMAELKSMVPDLAGYRIAAVDFTGGTPLLLSAFHISEFLIEMKRLLPVAPDLEVSVETIPGKLDHYNFQEFGHGGVTRLSMGYCTADRDEHALLGRPGRYDLVGDSMALCVAHGFDNVSLDVLLGIPGQTDATWGHTLSRLVKLAPAHVRFIRFRPQRLMARLDAGEHLSASVAQAAQKELPQVDALAAWYTQAEEALREAGYNRYAFDLFAKPGFESRYGLMRLQGAEVLGIGVNARTFMGGYAYRNTTDLGLYLEASTDAEKIVCDPRTIDAASLAIDSVTGMLSLDDGLSKEKLPSVGVGTCEELTGCLERLVSEGFVGDAGSSFKLTAKGAVCSADVFEKLADAIRADAIRADAINAR